ncbi:hypothetical protein [Streptomyces sp. NPDC048419]|uniref:hypothetical protein n=1 Tax=Streptomyces sp. NPDC048419 TaxID=3365547 RepID=UPI003718681A
MSDLGWGRTGGGKDSGGSKGSGGPKDPGGSKGSGGFMGSGGSKGSGGFMCASYEGGVHEGRGSGGAGFRKTPATGRRAWR